MSIPSAFVPWVWDAILREDVEIIEIIAMSRNACKFKMEWWLRLVEDYPMFSSQLGDGNPKNILVPVDNSFNYGGYNKNYPPGLQKGLIDRTVTCRYLDNTGSVISSLQSIPISAVPGPQMSAVVIRCPLPRGLNAKLQIEKVSLEINMPSVLLPHHIEGILTNSTGPFHVCGLEDYQKALSKVPFSDTKLIGVVTQKPQYDLLVCTATARLHRNHLVEWLEHHLALGVNHFVLYDTTHHSATSSATSLLTDILEDYVSEGVVTVVRWPYENCVRGMASGRHVALFKTPGTIAHNAALASCFSRNKHRSRWISHIDDDEFLAIRPDLGTLTEMADRLTQNDSRLSALYFQPHLMHDCRCRAAPCSNVSSPQNLPPRLGQWLYGSEGPSFEGKLIMNTQAIGMFFVHYLTMIEKGKWRERAYQVPVTDGALLHFRVPAIRSGSIYGALLRQLSPTNKRISDLREMEEFEDFDVNTDNVLEDSLEANLWRKEEPLGVCRYMFRKERQEFGQRKSKYTNIVNTISRQMHDLFISERLDQIQAVYSKRTTALKP